MANIDEWRWKLSLLLRSTGDQEIVSRDKRDRRDYEQIAGLTQRMGLYWFEKILSSSNKLSTASYTVNDYKCN